MLYAEPESEEAEGATEADTERVSEPEEEAGEAEEATASPLDDLEYDDTNPAQKAAYEELRRQLMPKWQKRVEKLKATAKPAAKAAEGEQAKEAEAAPQEPEQASPAEGGGEFDYFAVDTNAFSYAGDPEPDDSDLSGYEAAMDRRIEAGVRKGIEYVLGRMRDNDLTVRRSMAEQSVRSKLEEYATAIAEHPDFEATRPALAKMLETHKDMALRDPEEWIAYAEFRTGLRRDWAKEREEEKPTPDTRGEQRLLGKTRASVPRPTSSPSSRLASPSKGNMGFDDAFDAAERAFNARA